MHVMLALITIWGIAGLIVIAMIYWRSSLTVNVWKPYWFPRSRNPLGGTSVQVA